MGHFVGRGTLCMRVVLHRQNSSFLRPGRFRGFNILLGPGAICRCHDPRYVIWAASPKLAFSHFMSFLWVIAHYFSALRQFVDLVTLGMRFELHRQNSSFSRFQVVLWVIAHFFGASGPLVYVLCDILKTRSFLISGRFRGFSPLLRPRGDL